MREDAERKCYSLQAGGHPRFQNRDSMGVHDKKQFINNLVIITGDGCTRFVVRSFSVAHGFTDIGAKLFSPARYSR